MDLPAKFNQQLAALRRQSPANMLMLLAVSGGADSVVLTDLLYRSGLQFFIAHCNFQLRNDESERDEQFVKALAHKYGKSVFVKKFETEKYARENKMSVQVAARALRYQWFRELLEAMPVQANEQPAKRWIVTAHHADDNIETVVMNFFRGTGLKGLMGMDVFHEGIFRPLLFFRKDELLQYATANKLEYVDDSSNANTYYTRNYFRNELLPAITRVFPAVSNNILNNINRLNEVGQVYSEAIAGYKQKIVESKDNEEHIPVLKLQKLTAYKTVLWEIIKEKNFLATQVDEVVKLMKANNASHVESATHRIIKNRKWLIIAPKQAEQEANHVLISAEDKKVNFEEGMLKIEKNIPVAAYTVTSDKNIAAFDADEMQFPLLLRKWKQGDYFYPLGMRKKKKLSRFFIDEKLSPTEKEKVWVIEMNKKIVWIINYRIDDRFKIKLSTKQVLTIAFGSRK